MSRNASERRKRRRRTLYLKQGGRCHWCRDVMIWPDVVTAERDPRSCTLDHLDDRFSAERGQHRGEERTVAACWQCNFERGRDSQSAVPIEELWQRSGRRALAAQETDNAG